MASALIAGLGIVAIADYISAQASSSTLNYLFVEMAMVGVVTALVAFVHVHDRTNFGLVILGMITVAWVLAAVLLGPVLAPMIPLALIAIMSSGTGILRELRQKAAS